MKGRDQEGWSVRQAHGYQYPRISTRRSTPTTMNILLLAPMPPRAQAPGAIPVVLHAHLEGLTPQHRVTVVTVAGPDPAEWEAVEQLPRRGVDVQAVRRVEPVGARRWARRWRLASSWLGGRWPWRTVWFWDPGVQRIVDRLLSERRFDLVLVEDNAMGVYRVQTTAPVIFTEYEVRRSRPVAWSSWRPRKGLIWALAEADWHRWPHYQRAVWRRFARIQVFTPRDAASIRVLAPALADRVRVNPFAVNLPAEADPAREERNSILFVGNFTHPPNVDAALYLGLEVMPFLRELAPGVRLTLVGGYAPRSVQALQCDDITVTGYVPSVEPYFARAAVVVAPVRTGGGMRMKVLQSMASGKAVVTTPRGAEGLVIDGQPTPLVFADEPAGIARATASLLQADGVRRELARRARAFAIEHYSPRAYARRLDAIISELRSAPRAQ
jgi:glycosyltransferase involved in cell wall biosynthesis